MTFVDAAVAIALTLLVLPLVDAAGELDDDGSVTALLSDNLDTIFAFLLSFVVIANFWTIQHQVMSAVSRADGTVVRLLLLWTLCIVVLPFPTALLTPASSQPATKLLYIGTMIVSVAALSALSRHVSRHPHLTGDERIVSEASHGWFATGSLTVALLLSLAIPALSYFPLLLLIVDERLVGFVRRRLRP